ncbi:MAG: hypothetical protein AB7K24_30060 [Gemmataceae bacterium]
MSNAAVLEHPGVAVEPSSSARVFAGAVLCLAAAAALLAGWAPLGFSIVIVFLFAGPHNWFEARYFLTRLPGRWGKLRNYFVFGLGGVAVLTASFIALPWLGSTWQWTTDEWTTASAFWNTSFIIWVMVLIQMRSKQNPRRDWFWTVPVGFTLLALTWMATEAWELGLVYLHPLMALWILDRELKRSKPEWRAAYHGCLAVVPLFLMLLYWRLADAPALPGTDALSVRIAWHAGAGILSDVSVHFLVAAHAFLEMLHYSVWLIAIPLITFGAAPWRLNSIPMARRSASWKWGIAGVIALGGLIVLGLWACFLADYPATRDLYFTMAIFHVLAEFPFLLRSL